MLTLCFGALFSLGLLAVPGSIGVLLALMSIHCVIYLHPCNFSPWSTLWHSLEMPSQRHALILVGSSSSTVNMASKVLLYGSRSCTNVSKPRVSQIGLAGGRVQWHSRGSVPTLVLSRRRVRCCKSMDDSFWAAFDYPQQLQ
jgi:hypothetical protein